MSKSVNIMDEMIGQMDSFNFDQYQCCVSHRAILIPHTVGVSILLLSS